MRDEPTTIAVQRYLDRLDGDTPVELVVRDLLDRASRRLSHLCGMLLHKCYPRLTRAPLQLQTDEMLGALTERLLKALKKARPADVRQFFSLAGQHMRWELNDLARRLDEHPPLPSIGDIDVAAPESTDSGLTPDALRILDAIERLPTDEREAFDLVRIQGFSQGEAAEILGVSAMTVGRRMNRGLLLLTAELGDLRPMAEGKADSGDEWP